MYGDTTSNIYLHWVISNLIMTYLATDKKCIALTHVNYYNDISRPYRLFSKISLEKKLTQFISDIPEVY